MSELISIKNDGELVWDEQTGLQISLDYLRGRTIEFVELGDDEGIIIHLEDEK